MNSCTYSIFARFGLAFVGKNTEFFIWSKYQYRILHLVKISIQDSSSDQNINAVFFIWSKISVQNSLSGQNINTEFFIWSKYQQRILHLVKISIQNYSSGQNINTELFIWSKYQYRILYLVKISIQNSLSGQNISSEFIFWSKYQCSILDQVKKLKMFSVLKIWQIYCIKTRMILSR